MALEQLIGNPNYEGANIATKNAIFEKFAKDDPNFTSANEATKEAIRDRFGVSQAAIDREFQSAGTPSVLDTKSNERNLGGIVKQSAIKGVSGLGDIVMGLPKDVSNLYQYFTTKDAEMPLKSRPVTGFLQRQGVLTPENEPNNPLYKAIDFTTQVATGGGVNPYTLGRSVATKPLLQASGDIGKQFGRIAVAGPIGSATQQSLEAVGASPIQQMIGTGITMGATGAATGGLRSTPADVVNRGLTGVTPAQLRLAEMLQQESIRLGMPLTGAEAIAQVTGNKALTATQRFVENAPASSATMSQFMAGRPAGVQQGFGNVMQQVSPREPTSATPARLQSSAENLIGGARESLTQNNDLLYKQAGRVNVYPAPAIFANPRIEEAVNEVTKTAKYGVKGGNPNSFETLIAAKKYLDDEYSTQMSGATGLQIGASSITKTAKNLLNDYLKENSPQYKRGAKNYETALGQQINPIQQGPVGQIAGGDVSRNVLMPATPVSLYPADIKRTAELLRRKDPTALPDWTRQNLESIFNETTQKLSSGENQFGGPKFASTIAGNKQQRDNLRTLVTETGGMQAWQGFEKFLDVTEAQGQRMQANSATSFNDLMKQDLGTGKASKALAPLKLFSNVVDWAENVQLGRNTQMLAKMLTDPDSVAKLQELARTGPKSAKAQTIANSLAGAYVAPKPELTEELK